MFDGAPIARNFAGACGSVLSSTSWRLRQDVAAPHARQVEEEALVFGVAVDLLAGFCGILLQRDLQRVVGDVEAAEVGDVLAQRQLAVDVLAGGSGS